MPATLESLPLEIHYLIFQYLIDRVCRSRYKHPLLTLASTSTALQSVIESYTHYLLRLHHQRFPQNPISSPHALSIHRKHSYRATFVRLTRQNCRFCDKKTQCTAILFPEIVCCRKCDKKIWPDKITLTNAKKVYGLTAEELKMNCVFGVYMCMNTPTTMFMEPEVRRYAESVHGDLETWREKKKRRLKTQDGGH